MNVIRTDERGWQKQMATLMKRKCRFLILTNNEELATRLVSGRDHRTLLKLIALGTAGGSAVSGGGVVGVGLVAKMAVGSGMLAAVNPEPHSKVALAAISGAFLLAGASFMVVVISALVNNRYRFSMKADVKGYTFGVEGEPV